MTSITLHGVSKSYGSFKALKSVDLSVVQGELLSLLGPSGCGKTTMLRLIAGLIDPSEGQVSFGDAVMNGVPPNKRNVGLVFQNYSLFPHMTVFQNVAFGLRMRGVDAKTIKSEVSRMLEMVQLRDQGERYPSQLSGGQQQRVGLARALVIKPAVLLLDEPFGALDKKLRDSMQLELRQLQQALKVTSIFVTHDQEEALTISDRIAVVSDGRIEQIDTPQALYEAPSTQFVLHFVGASNNFHGKISSADGSGIVVETPQGLKIRSTAKPRADLAVGKEVIIACRPEKAWLMPADEPRSGNSVPGVVKEEVYLGSVTHYFIDGPEHREMRVYQLNAPGGRAERVFHVGERVNLVWGEDHSLVFLR